jgi:hypothetical protein
MIMGLFIGRSVAFSPKLKELTKSTVATLLLCQMLYWTPKSNDGWIYKTADDWQEETGLTEQEQRTARKRLCDMKIMREKRDNINHQLFYKLNLEVLEELWVDYSGQEAGFINLTPKSISQDVKKELDEIKPNRQSNPTKIGDGVDFEMLGFPAARKQKKIEIILTHIQQQFKVNAFTKNWRTFGAFALERYLANHEDIRTFTSWALENDFNPIYWSPNRCTELWDAAFAKDNKPFVNDIIPEVDNSEVIPAPDEFFKVK